MRYPFYVFSIPTCSQVVTEGLYRDNPVYVASDHQGNGKFLLDIALF